MHSWYTFYMQNDFSTTLSQLRRAAKLTNIQLADKAHVSRSIIPGLQSGKRVIGECQASKIGAALQLEGKELESFIFCGINRCTEKVLKQAQAYPAELLNLLALQLRRAGILPEHVSACVVDEDATQCVVGVLLADGSKMHLKTMLEVDA